ncbi:MAG: DUF134 domain-containing protein [Bacilli bacterium]|jgi:predicted DNA-binding protein (UPF0251 family)|nr:DUF134 domain-containing protein [Bacilli bacterium]MDD4056963.1 DUF134 domain-containing protein [Bacilli bacterium]MDY0209480.1 DUF134 domain-containing protein [Bacilli bacterium]
MARPSKCKRICFLPENIEFSSENNPTAETIVLTIEEFECTRLIDYEGLSQEECALRMNVARTTVQRLYSDARKKMATFFVEGKKLTIKGGNYILCSKESDICLQRGNCHRHQRHNKFNRGDKE